MIIPDLYLIVNDKMGDTKCQGPVLVKKEIKWVAGRVVYPF